MAILTCKHTCECISLQIFSKYPIQKSRDRTNPPDLPTLKAYPTPGVGGRFGIFSLKWRERMNLKVPQAILPLGCAILSTRARTVRGVTTPLRRTRVKSYLTNRNQCVSVNNSMLTPNVISSWEPKASILGPFCFFFLSMACQIIFYTQKWTQTIL